jgi:pyruvate/2-oxoglutarate dehydrogenase complex dihydrolipoamide dehydrogenase (E3) component
MSVKLATKTDGGEKEMLCSHALATAGRVPSTNDLGLEKTSVQLDKISYVLVNEKLETSAEGV